MGGTTGINQTPTTLEDIVVTAARSRTTSSANEENHKQTYLQKSEQNLQLKGRLSDIVAAGGTVKYTGNYSDVYIGPTLSFQFRFFEVEIQKRAAVYPAPAEYEYAHLAYPQDSSFGFDATQQKNNYSLDAYLTGFSCGGNVYQNIVASTSGIAQGDVLKNVNSGSGSAAASVAKVALGDQVSAGMYVCNEKGGNSLASGGKGFALTAGLWNSSSITGAAGTDINYTSAAVLTDAAGEGFAVGRVFQPKGSNASGVLALNFKTGYRTGI